MRSKAKYQKSFVILTFVLIVMGLMALISASSITGAEKHNDVLYFVKKQLLQGILGGVILAWIVSKIHYHNWKKLSLILLIVNIALVGLCFIGPFKYVVNYAYRWLKLGPIIFQPSEFLKITYILFLGAVFAKVSPVKLRKIFASPFLLYITSLGIIAIILALQPSTGTFLILTCGSLAMYLSAGLSWKQCIVLCLLGGLFLGGLILQSDYRLDRIKTFFMPDADPLGKGYQTRQSLIGIGSGGIFGRGFGNSIQKFNYLPESHTDAIFSIIAEEFGFIGSISVLIIYLLFISFGLAIAKETADTYGKFLIIGLIGGIGAQAFINIAAMCKIIPITGIPLPFISYGSSALITNLIAVGIIINIAKQT